jgi:hypothetical protein
VVGTVSLRDYDITLFGINVVKKISDSVLSIVSKTVLLFNAMLIMGAGRAYRAHKASEPSPGCQVLIYIRDQVTKAFRCSYLGVA